jgi:coenzyme Q-binding protein COQ10
MFALVADVEKYPLFVPMCEALTVKSRRERDGRELLLADMSVGYKLIREMFTSQVLLDREALVIETKYIDGPFKYLNNRWRFEAVSENSCNVHFFIDYEFKSRRLGIVMGSMFDIAFRRFTHAFETRADEIYAR